MLLWCVFSQLMCSVHFALTGDLLVFVHEYEGKTAKEVKQSVAAQIGVSRFRQRLTSERFHEIQDDHVFAVQDSKVFLTLLEFWPAAIEEDIKLLSAAKDSNLVALEQLLRCPRNPDATDSFGRIPLHYAARYGHIGPMQLLIEARATTDAGDTPTRGVTPLIWAAAGGRAQNGGLLLETEIDEDMATPHNESTPLHYAAQRGHVEVVQLLLYCRADVDGATSDNGTKPLHMAAENGHFEVVRLLLDGRADVDRTTTDDGSTPLHMAAENGHVEVVQLLLDVRAYVDRASNDDGTTPLFLATLNGYFKVVQLLLDGMADVNRAATVYGTTPLHMAAENGHFEVVQMLLDGRADVDRATTDDATSPLCMAAWNDHSEVVRLLLDRRADVANALHMASKLGNDQVVACLQQAAAINHIDHLLGCL